MKQYFQKYLVRLRHWAIMPGNDFEAAWTQPILDHEWIGKIWAIGIESWAKRLHCLFFPHVVVNDHCGKPDHRYCLICERRCPHEELAEDPFTVYRMGLPQ